MSLFYDLFSEHRQALSAFDKALEKAEIIRLIPDLNEDSLTIVVKFPILLREETLDRLDRQLEKLLGVATVQLEPVFEKRLLTEKYNSQLIEIIKRRVVVANGFLDGCEFSYNEDMTQLNLRLKK